jgi:hypothetical protein
MPLFFFLSGIFFEKKLKRRGYKDFLKNNISTLLFPLIAWSYIQFFIQFFASGSINIKVTSHDVYLAPFPPRQQFWFLWTLFLILTLAGIVMQFKPHRLVLGAIGLICIGMNLLGLGDIGASTPVSTLIRFTPYFIIGVLGGASAVESLKLGSFFTILTFIMSLVIYQLMGNDFEYIRLLTSTICILSVYKMSLNLSQRMSYRKPTMSDKILLLIGINSMIIYLAHVIFSAAFRVLLVRIGITDISIHLIGAIIIGIAMPLALIPLFIRLSKLSPFVLGSIFPVRLHRAPGDLKFSSK